MLYNKKNIRRSQSKQDMLQGEQDRLQDEQHTLQDG
jgi:hypothetical protein